MYIANYNNKTGEILGFYLTDIHKNIPEPNIKLTEKQYQDYQKQTHYKILDKTFTYVTPSPPSLDSLKQDKWQQIKNIRDQTEQKGLPYMGKTLDSDTVSIQRITTAVQAAQIALSLNQEFNINWTTQDNTNLTMTAQDVLGIPIALAQYSNTLHEKARQLKDKIDEAKTVEELEEILWIND